MARPDEDPNGLLPSSFFPFEADPPSGTESPWTLRCLWLCHRWVEVLGQPKLETKLSRLTVQGSGEFSPASSSLASCLFIPYFIRQSE